MKLLVALIVVLAGICLAQAASTTRRPHSHRPHPTGHVTGGHHNSHGTHPTREPSEKEQFGFNYQPQTQHFYIHSGPTCYVATLTLDEAKAVHTDTGIRTLELKFLQMMDVATSVTKDQISTEDAKFCGKRATTFFTIP